MSKSSKAAAAPAAAAPARITLAAAKAHNFALSANPSALAPSGVVKTAKGENEHRVRVYGYDNGAGAGRVNKAATIAVVPGTTGLPRGVTAGQWAKLADFAGTVQQAYDAGTTSRTVRRAYRAGFIRFVA